MIKYITIESWFETKRIQANKPTKWRKLLAWLNLRPLPEPLYWFGANIEIAFPHPLRLGDIIFTRNSQQYHVMSKLPSSALYRETFSISSYEPTEKMMPELGKTVILASACMNEMDPNTQPYGGQIV